jgi:hypothetical protein
MNHNEHGVANAADSTQDRGEESSLSRETPVQAPATRGSAHGGHGCCGPGGAPSVRSSDSPKDETGAVQAHASHGGMFGHFGHMFHMAPMVLILLAPRLGTRLTVVLAVALAAYFAVTWAQRRRTAAEASSMSGASNGQDPADVGGVELER